ncbi:MAG: hypothetical protein AMXMBFR56_55480 [Polyangiaceae bacterium]
MALKRAYPDANVALHYRPFDEIDWCSLVDATEVEIVLTAVFLREVEQQKDRGRGVVQKRARRVSSWLSGLRKSGRWEIRPGVRVVPAPSEPDADVDFAKYGLVSTVNDDRFLACILRDRAQVTDANVVCVTADGLLVFKADAQGIPVVEPRNIDRLADEPDEQERELRELRKQLAAVEGARPELELRWLNGDALAEVALAVIEPLSEEDIDNYLSEEGDEIAEPEAILLAIGKRPPSEKECADYLQKLREWVRAADALRVMRSLTFQVPLVLHNGGTGNAATIDIDLVFPVGLRLAEQRELPKLGQRPKPPKPTGPYDMLFAPQHLGLGALSSALGLEPNLRGLFHEAVRLSFDEEDSNCVHVEVDSLKHTSDVELPPFEAWFESAATVPTGLAIKYRIHSASTPEIRTGQLHVKLSVSRLAATIPEEDEPEERDED